MILSLGAAYVLISGVVVLGLILGVLLLRLNAKLDNIADRMDDPIIVDVTDVSELPPLPAHRHHRPEVRH